MSIPWDIRFVSDGLHELLQTIILKLDPIITHLIVQIQQSAATAKYAGPVDCAKQLYKEGGIRSVYKGTVATLARGNVLCILLLEHTLRDSVDYWQHLCLMY